MLLLQQQNLLPRLQLQAQQYRRLVARGRQLQQQPAAAPPSLLHLLVPLLPVSLGQQPRISQKMLLNATFSFRPGKHSDGDSYGHECRRDGKHLDRASERPFNPAEQQW